MHSDCRVWVVGEELSAEVSDDLVSVSVGEQLSPGGYTKGQVALPLKRTEGDRRRPYADLLRVGDLIHVEMSNWSGRSGSSEGVLSGVITDISEQEVVTPNGYQASCTLSVANMGHILSRDTVAWWMYWGTKEGWARTDAFLLPEEQNTDPSQAAFNYLRKVAMPSSVYSNLGYDLNALVSLDMQGLRAVGPFQWVLNQFEGSHLGNISQFLDPPFQELYVTTDRRENVKGKNSSLATNPFRLKADDSSATTLRWRAAPYPYADEDGTTKFTEWNLLKLHTVTEEFPFVGGSNRSSSDQLIRNFFMVYPAVQFIEEYQLFATGAALTNDASQDRFGVIPMKIRTHLIHGEHAEGKEPLEQFMLRLAWRLATQHNRLHEMMYGSCTLPLMPWVRIGERLRGPSLWHSSRESEYHISSRQLTWNPVTGGQMILGLERGLEVDIYRDGVWFTKGLKPARVGSETLGKYRRVE